VQACEGLECGDDGCGGSCGTCGEHQACHEGSCVAQPWCGDGACGPDETCASCPADCACDDAHVCVEGACEPRPCDPVCSGRECGDDGCGGSCGECPKGDVCRADGTCPAGQPDGEEPDVVGPDAPTLDVGSGDGVAPDEELEEQGEGGSCAVASGSAGHSAWSLLLALATLGLARARRRVA
jgi:MYXO-CTERM domain-containing protein